MFQPNEKSIEECESEECESEESDQSCLAQEESSAQKKKKIVSYIYA